MSGEFLQNDNIVGTFIRNGIIFSNRPRIVKKVLWTNPNSTASFTGQTVTLSDSISNYKYIAVKWKDSTSVDQVGEIVLDSANFMTQSPAPNYYNFPAMVSSNQSFVRAMVYISDNQIQFGNCYKINANASNNAYSIPLTIIGIKEEFETVNGTDQYSYQGYKSLAASAIPTFTTVAKAKAVWILYTLTASAYRSLALTNVNPYTSVVDNDAIYQIDTAYLGRALLTANKFIVTDNEVKTLNALGSQAVNVSIIYTYGEPKDDPPSSEETVLWTNPNASDTFSNQNVTLSDDINNYNYIKVKYKVSALEEETICSVEKFKTYTGTLYCALGGTDSSGYFYSRPFWYNTDTSITFNHSWKFKTGSGATADGTFIPVQVIGIK